MAIRVGFAVIPNDGDPIIIATATNGHFMGIVDAHMQWTPTEASLRAEYLNATYAGVNALHVWRDLWPQRR